MNNRKTRLVLERVKLVIAIFKLLKPLLDALLDMASNYKNIYELKVATKIQT
jgi:hypothetical protein